ncbi:aminoglycoside phosphotransferase family protein [Vibrio sp. SCSIO 43136]|uniref:aminoglycoside phosphotransferase family protein n=1 Tax=Vibrio sp. SCSIO 43136 TaxID=2819101 RepID=UPI002074B6DE|nr:aminoglycoside phosphotransferase family protein [Vibrio sp. SCSIO 43136]USD65155.1 capsular biosynthesis protein [Vibrio sp. SCSIO 43136]
MFLIMSGAYIDQELQSEFGKIPPSFLPLGNRRLFEHQVKFAPNNKAVFLTVPESYEISPTDQHWLAANDVTIVPIPDALSLGASLVAAINLCQHNLDTSLCILFGDTLFTELPHGEDVVSISSVQESYNWSIVTEDSNHWLQDTENQIDSELSHVVNGYFCFTDAKQLVRSVTRSKWSFLEGLNDYHQTHGLKTIKSDCWLDFGHVNTYYRSKANFTTQRAFNSLTINANWIEKSSSKNQKITAEAHWFEAIPYSIRQYTPQFLGATKTDETTSYRLEYLHLTALNELYVFSALPKNIWKQILSKCLEFLKACQNEQAPAPAKQSVFEQLMQVKTAERIQEYTLNKGFTLDQQWQFNELPAATLKQVMAKSEQHLPNHSLQHNSVMHGDFCFSNILYDFRANKIKTIDPRGITPSGELSIYGDIRYDIAKLSHSILGMYDWIIAGQCDVTIDEHNIRFQIFESPTHQAIQTMFIDMVAKEFALSEAELLAMQIQLFLSMLPLHSDDKKRQQALFANAFRLYHQLKGLTS